MRYVVAPLVLLPFAVLAFIVGAATPVRSYPSAPPGPRTDNKSAAILKRVDAAISAIQAVKASYTDTFTWSDANGKHIFPTVTEGTMYATHDGRYKEKDYTIQKVKATHRTKRTSGTTTIYNGGDTEWVYEPDNKIYYKYPSEPHADLIFGFAVDMLEPYQHSAHQLFDNYKYVWYSGLQMWKGRQYVTLGASRIDTNLLAGEIQFVTTTVYIGADNLVHRVVQRTRYAGGSYAGSILVDDAILTGLHRLPSLPNEAFVFHKPAGAVEKNPYEEEAETPPLATGTVAPNFTVYDAAGQPVKLSDYKRQVVVIDFWATWCGPCQISLPGTNAAAASYVGKDVSFLAINVWDTKEAFKAWLPQHKALTALHFLIDTTPGQGKDIASSLYKVSGIPTQFVIGADGKVVDSFVGDNPSTKPLTDAVDKALAQVQKRGTASVTMAPAKGPGKNEGGTIPTSGGASPPSGNALTPK